jgi:predicted AAA+ superfamily ATPase
MLRRKIYEDLLRWKNNHSNTCLMVKGARQVGKTYIIRAFGEKEYKSFIEINFISQKELKSIFAGSLDAESVYKRMTAQIRDIELIPGKTLIFFDEITEFPEIATSLKFFCIDGRFDVICSGSMLGVNYKRIESNSVGYKKDYEMFSMDFEEFLWAKGYGDDTVQSVLSHMKELTPFSALEMNVFHSLFLDYNILGGMPAVVREYIERNTFEGSLDIQKQLIADYKEDIRKYASGVDQTRIINVFNRVAPQLARENKKFQISKVASGARFRDYRGCAEWLADAGMVNICYCMEFPELPLGGNYEPDKFKLYFSDTGLLVSMLDDESQEDLRANKNLGVYKGALYENMVGEALIKQGYKLFYYKKEDSTLEADFFIRGAVSLIPVEVKAKSGRAKSMNTLIASDHYPDIRYGIKLSKNNIGHEDRTYTFPYFCTFLLRRFMSGFQAEEEAEYLKRRGLNG